MVGSQPKPEAWKLGWRSPHEFGRNGDITGTYWCRRCGQLVDTTRPVGPCAGDR